MSDRHMTVTVADANGTQIFVGTVSDNPEPGHAADYVSVERFAGKPTVMTCRVTDLSVLLTRGEPIVAPTCPGGC